MGGRAVGVSAIGCLLCGSEIGVWTLLPIHRGRWIAAIRSQKDFATISSWEAPVGGGIRALLPLHTASGAPDGVSGAHQMSEQSGGLEPNTVSTQLASLVPTFNPATDDVIVYRQKIELVLAAWPKNRLTELVTRLILNCQGTAFQKLQLHHAELLTGDEKAVQKIVELLGGQWGQIGLERQYEDAKNALYHCQQRADESNDSYLARADVLWSKFMSRKVKMEDLQPYVLLRGSNLSPEEKKRVILESDQSLEGKLTTQRVTEAIRILGASFFFDMTGQKKSQRTKVYDQTALLTQDNDEGLDAAFQADDVSEGEFIDALQATKTPHS